MMLYISNYCCDFVNNRVRCLYISDTELVYHCNGTSFRFLKYFITLTHSNPPSDSIDFQASAEKFSFKFFKSY